MIHIDALRDFQGRLIRRLPGEDPETLDALADLSIGSVRRATHRWGECEDMSIDKALEIALPG